MSFCLRNGLIRSAGLPLRRSPLLFQVYKQMHTSPFVLQHNKDNDAGNTTTKATEGEKGTQKPVKLAMDTPSYQLTFTCKPCQHRSSHTFSKQAYNHGAVLIQCPNCKARHLIADHLGFFSDKKTTLEQILASKGSGEEISKYSMSPNGDLIWEPSDPPASPHVETLAIDEGKAGS